MEKTICDEDFDSYLERTSKINYINYHRNINGEVSANNVSYGHRWSIAYRKRLFFRLFLVEKYFLLLPQRKMTFLTLTTRQNGLSQEEQFALLREGWNKLKLKFTKWKIARPSYILNWDFHKSGYGHIHVCFFGELPLWLWQKADQWWQNAGYGGKNGVKFVRKDDVKRVVSYMFAHSKKIFNPSNPGWHKFHEAVYNLYHSGKARYRLFSCSRDISNIMRMPEDDENKTLLLTGTDRAFYCSSDFDECDQDEIDDYIRWFRSLGFE